MKIPEFVGNIIKRLHDSGHAAYVVGGCVRDTVMGIEPHDWDVCTSALPEEVMRIFDDHRVVTSGLKHGTVTVVAHTGDDDAHEALAEKHSDIRNVEITTFRSESGYSDGRHPDEVVFVSDINKDLARRDFTVNAMAYSPYDGFADPFGGQSDIKNGILRCVGSPGARFSEDALRILRALRFMSEKGLKPDAATDEALRRDYRLLAGISQERITEEFTKFMCGRDAARLLDSYKEIFCFLIPELEPMIGFEQHSPYHNRDVWQHTLCAVDDIPPTPVFRLTMLFHDIAKPVVGIIDDTGRGRFRGHPAKGAEMTEVIMKRMKFSKSMTEHVVRLVKYHDAKIKRERVSVRKWLSELGKETFYELMYVRHADASGKYEKYIGEAEKKNEVFARLAEQIEKDGDCIDIKSLAVKGGDIAAAGLTGEDIGNMLRNLLDKVMNDDIPNEKNALMAEAMRLSGAALREG